MLTKEKSNNKTFTYWIQKRGRILFKEIVFLKTLL